MSAGQQTRINHLAHALHEAVTDNPADVVLLSGGLDSSLLPALRRVADQPLPEAITVGLAGERPCPIHASLPVPCNGDLAYAALAVKYLNLAWHPLRLDMDTALAHLDDLMRLRGSFDLGLLNDIPILAGLRHAQSLGARSFWTGDDADTLFGGYRFLRAETDWPAFLASRIPAIDPPARAIGEHLGMTPV
ncbi:MAG: asparagine synthase C-terminal domain-containing protein, partial [Chloroflexota bacterium]|nr:asparagine synthase C-terminal domain-containing protein [Chloroflexota bacterium]